MKENKGITLIALIITIIVMLILVAVTITMAVNGGLFGYAGNAVKETEIEKNKELQIANGILGGKTIDDLVAGFKSLEPNTTIPTGGIYLRMSDWTAYYSEITTDEEDTVDYMFGFYEYPITFNNFTKAGDEAPEGLKTMDIYLYGDYVYIYNFDPGNGQIDGWTAIACYKTKTSYGQLLSSINGENLKNLYGTFAGCSSLTTAPEIPGSVTNMCATFTNCTSLTIAPSIPVGVTTLESAFENCPALTTVPTIPSTVTNMSCAFAWCISLTSVPAIPSNVTNMAYTFSNCHLLAGTITLNANPTEYTNCFADTIELIHLIGDSTMLSQLASTSNGNVTT